MALGEPGSLLSCGLMDLREMGGEAGTTPPEKMDKYWVLLTPGKLEGASLAQAEHPMRHAG